MEKEKQLYSGVETVTEFTYLGGRRCEVAVTAKTRCGWAMLMECGELLH